MRGSKHQKGDKMDIPMPVNAEHLAQVSKTRWKWIIYKEQ